VIESYFPVEIGKVENGESSVCVCCSVCELKRYPSCTVTERDDEPRTEQKVTCR
jgi:hypothetical protein